MIVSLPACVPVPPMIVSLIGVLPSNSISALCTFSVFVPVPSVAEMPVTGLVALPNSSLPPSLAVTMISPGPAWVMEKSSSPSAVGPLT